jgi:hypothetical protein
MESQSMFGDKKPNCVILDEIDGADAKGAIQAVRCWEEKVRRDGWVRACRCRSQTNWLCNRAS